MSHASRLLDLAAIVDELLERIRHVEDVPWEPTREAIDAVAQRARHEQHATGRIVRAVTPTRVPSRRDRRRHATTTAGLLAQLGDLADHTITATGEPTTRTAPESRTPPGSTVVELLDELHVDILATWLRVETATRAERLIGSARRSPRRPRSTDAALRGLVGLAADLDEPAVDDLVRTAASWARQARVALGWDVPAIRLPGSRCPACEGHNTLRALADGSVAWCSGQLIGPTLPELQPPARWPGARLHSGPVDVDAADVARCTQRWNVRRDWRILVDAINHQEAS